jgi:hypothetical protein
MCAERFAGSRRSAFAEGGTARQAYRSARVRSQECEVDSVRLVALLLPLFVLGCRSQHTVARVDLEPVPTRQLQASSRDFVAYVQSLRGARYRAVVYDFGTRRQNVVAESAGTRLDLRPLPVRWLHFDHPVTEAERRRTKAAPYEPVYVDAYSGAKVEHDPALGLGDGRTALIDLAEGRTLIARQDARSRGTDTVGTLILYRDGKPRELGRILVVSPGRAVVVDWALSPDRNRLAWTGPDGSFLADLTTGEVRKQAHKLVFGRLSDPPSERRKLHWLPDGSGFLEQWLVGGKPHWELFGPDGEGPTASGEGRVREISLDCSYWAIVNEEAMSGSYLKPGQTPRFIRPVPGHSPAPGTCVATRKWVIHDQTVEFYIVQSTGPDTYASLRVTPTGAEMLPGVDLRNAARVGNALAVARHAANGWQVKLTDLRTGRETVVLSRVALRTSVGPAGERHFIATAWREDTQAVICNLYVGGVDGRPWRLLAEDVCAPLLVPPQPGDPW